jgi:hypothetical protein
MAVTAKGTPYVESSDLVANYPGVSLALANHIDTIGKVLQVVRATDATNRTTTSTSYVDVTGMSVTITPQQSTSAIIIMSNFLGNVVSYTANPTGFYQITDASNNVISGVQEANLGFNAATSGGFTALSAYLTSIAYDLPGSISAKTYKLRFRMQAGSLNITVGNSACTGQMYAIEVAA